MTNVPENLIAHGAHDLAYVENLRRLFETTEEYRDIKDKLTGLPPEEHARIYKEAQANAYLGNQEYREAVDEHRRLSRYRQRLAQAAENNGKGGAAQR